MSTWWNDYANNVLQGQSFYMDSPLINTQVIGVGVDMKEAQEGLHAQLETGTLTDGTIDVTLEESDVFGSGYTAIVDFITGNPAAFAQLAATEDNVSKSLNFKRSKRFVRAVAAGAGQTSGGRVAVSIHGMRRRVL